MQRNIARVDGRVNILRRFLVKKITFVILMMIPLSVSGLDNSDVYQTARRILADDIPVKAIAKISDENVEYLYWYALFSINRYDANVEIVKKVMQYRKEDGVEYTGVGKNGFPDFTNVDKLSKKQGEILRFLCECEMYGRRGKSNADFKVWLMDREEYLEEDIATDTEYADKSAILFSYRMWY
jgi:hypothetical protein